MGPLQSEGARAVRRDAQLGVREPTCASRRASFLTPNAQAHRELPKRDLSAYVEPPRGSDAVARFDTHPGLLCCGMQR